MQEKDNYTNWEKEEEIFSFRNYISHHINNIVWLIRFWKKLTIAGILGAVIALVYAFINPVTYTARTTFVVEDAKSTGGSLMSALAGQIGIDMGNLTGGNGLLAGDNVMELLKSHSLIKKTLLSPYNDTGKLSLADVYAEINGWKEQWKNNRKINTTVYFMTNAATSRLEDSLLQLIIKKVINKEISIAKPDKKLNIFELQVTSKDEKFSQLFCTRLITTTTDFYINTKTTRLRKNIERLQNRADSLGALLNKKTYSAAEATTHMIDVNPAFATPSVSAEISSREKYMQVTIYAEIIKNLELSKTALVQETPTVQIVDSPELPLKKNKTSKLLALIIGFGAGCFFMGLFIINQKENKAI